MSHEHLDTMAWSDLGSCTVADPDLFFPAPNEDTSPARAICRQCPVRSQCLEYALKSGQKHGIWGGMTESQRRRLRRHPSRDEAMRVPDPPLAEAQHAPVRHLRLVT